MVRSKHARRKGFFDSAFDRERAQAFAAWRRRQPNRPLFEGVQRISMPGVALRWVVTQVIGAVLNPMVMVGPELSRRLEPRIGRLCDICHPTWLQRSERALWHWLLEARDSEPEPTETDEQNSLAFLVAALEQMGLHSGTQTPPLPGSEVPGEECASSAQSTGPSVPAPQDHTIPGVR